MWGLTPARLSILAGAALIAFAVGGLLTWYGLAAPRIQLAEQKGRANQEALRAQYATGRADGEAAARLDVQAEQKKAQEANDARIKEYAAIAAAAARPPTVLRVCPPGAGPSAPAGGRPAGPAPGDPVPARPLDAADGRDPGAVLRAQLDRYAEDTERMSADLRAVVRACGG